MAPVSVLWVFQRWIISETSIVTRVPDANLLSKGQRAMLTFGDSFNWARELPSGLLLEGQPPRG